MKNNQKGFIVPLLVAIIAVLVIGGGVYIYNNKKVQAPATNTGTQQTNTQISADTSNWKTYSGVNFSLKYPPTFNVSSSPKSEAVSITNYDLHLLPGGSSSAVPLLGPEDLGIFIYTFNLSVNETLESWSNSLSLSNEQNILIDGIRAKSARKAYDDKSYKENILIIVHNGKGYQIIYNHNPKILSTFNQILSTFKFISTPVSVQQNASVKILSPNGGETWKLGSVQNIRWDSLSGIGSEVAIFLRPHPFSSSNRAYLITEKFTNTGSYSWKVLDTESAPGVPATKIPSGSYTLSICVLNTSFCDVSDNYFTITN